MLFGDFDDLLNALNNSNNEQNNSQDRDPRMRMWAVDVAVAIMVVKNHY